MADLPSDPLLRDYWVYEGSLTTPPCNENVTWILYRYPLTISQLQVKQNQRLQHFSSFSCVREVNKLHQRFCGSIRFGDRDRIHTETHFISAGTVYKHISADKAWGRGCSNVM